MKVLIEQLDPTAAIDRTFTHYGGAGNMVAVDQSASAAPALIDGAAAAGSYIVITRVARRVKRDARSNSESDSRAEIEWAGEKRAARTIRAELHRPTGAQVSRAS